MESSFSECKTLLSAPRYEQVRAIKQWFLPIFIKHLPGRLEDPTSAAQVIRPFCLAIDLMAQVKCYRCMFDLCMAALEQPCSHDFLTILVETLRRYLDIWASMSVLKKLVDGLYAMHQTCKTTRQHSRALLTLLVEIDANRYLDPAARKGVDNDISLYAQALRPADANPETVPMHIQEILILPNDARPGAASMLANSLWYRYRTAPNWAWRVWDDTFAALRLKLPTTVDITTARARARCYAEFLLHVDQHLPAGLDEHIAQWLAGAGIVELVAIDAEAWDCVIIALMYLIVHGALSTTTVLQGLVYPLWEIAHGSPEGVGQASQSSEVYLRAAHDVFARLLLHDACGADGIPPNDRVELQRVRTRRQDAFQGRHISALVASIPTLVFLEHSRRLPKELGHMSGVLRCAVCGVPEFRQAVYRDLNAVRDAFERTLRLDSLEESLVEPLMDALRLILNVARSDTADIGSSEWLDTSALLSPWKLAATAIEVQFTLKQMGERLALGTPHTNGNTKVDRLIAKLLRHHMSTEEADFVAEMARGVGPNIVGKFVNTGLRFIANVLAGMELSSPDFQKALDVSSEQLRLLAHLTESVRDGQTQPPTDSATQDEFITALADKIDAFEAALSGRSQRAAGSLSQEQLTQGAILMARLLQFDLACRDIWTPRARALSGRLCVSVFGLAMAHSAEVASDAKVTAAEIFRNYPQLQLSDLPSDLPAEYLQQLRGLLPFTPPNEAVADLAYASRDPAGQLVLGPAVVNRPWEWVENIGDLPGADPKEEEAGRRRRGAVVKNAGSLPLELFAARASAEAVVRRQDDARVEASVRSFQDNLAGQSLFARDWMESRIRLASEGARPARAEDADAVGALPSLPPHDPGAGAGRPPAGSRRPSPASSARSRGSARMSAPSSRLQSPHSRGTGTSSSDAIDVDQVGTSSSSAPAVGAVGAVGAARAGKRKVADEDVDMGDDMPAAKKGKMKLARPRVKKR
ncbi:hypothetical protein OF83DRAFT_1179208 [Amylostereum chailletii]|nr:hypothetical protein OF83DRAFT_1179208 [Amylostereum chailletii]